MVLVHMTGDRQWIEPPFQPERDGRLFAEESGGLPPDIQMQVRAALFECLTDGRSASHQIGRDLVHDMARTFVGEHVPAEYLPYLLEELDLEPQPPVTPITEPSALQEFSALIIGAGVSGICMAIELERLGVDYVIVEKNRDVGGTWFENRYPEAGVDTPNHFYSYSFARHDWSSYFSKAPEIHAYLRGVADRYGITHKIRFETTMESTVFDTESDRWLTTVLDCDGSRLSLWSNVVITAVGQVNRPKLPEVPGMAGFRGRLCHTARWPDDLRVDGMRVALVGTGASAVQAARTLGRQAAKLTIFQRSPQWIMPNPDYHRQVSDGKKFLLREVPFYADWYRIGLFWRYSDGVHSALKVDPEWHAPDRAVNATNDRHRSFLTRYMKAQLAGRRDLLAKCLPDYPPYGKRMVVDNDWFATLKRPNVELIHEAVAEMTANGLVTATGAEHKADIAVFATGFQTTRMLGALRVVGPDGVTLSDAWHEDEPMTYLGMTTPGFPNFFMLLGPTTALAHGGSVIFMVEAQARYIAECLSAMLNKGWSRMGCTAAAADAYSAAADEAHRNLVFSHPGMRNWYKNRSGRVVTVSPWRLIDYWDLVRFPKFDRYDCAGQASRITAPRTNINASRSSVADLTRTGWSDDV
jgi:4-hydroxyacetophenone monooxygenase